MTHDLHCYWTLNNFQTKAFFKNYIQKYFLGLDIIDISLI